MSRQKSDTSPKFTPYSRLKRQSIVEHHYGVIKSQWEFICITTKKTMIGARTDEEIKFTVFNLRRIINIIGKNQFNKFLEDIDLSVFVIIDSYRNICSNIRHPIFQPIMLSPKK